jgi:hypothetical protein
MCAVTKKLTRIARTYTSILLGVPFEYSPYQLRASNFSMICLILNPYSISFLMFGM